MSFSFHPEADEEFIEAVAHYEGCEPALGLDFSREVYASIRNALDYPTRLIGVTSQHATNEWTAGPGVGKVRAWRGRCEWCGRGAGTMCSRAA
jgi:hypothetical protein